MAEKMYDFFVGLVRPIYSLLYPVRVEGVENVPAEGGCLLCANHLSNRDPIYIAAHVRNRCLHFMAKIELFKRKPVAWFIRALGGFPVDRGHNDLGAVRTSLKLVADGHALAIFPQGTRSKENNRLPMLAGVSMIALRAGVPVIPAYIGGPYRLFHRTQVSFGKPVDLSDFGRRVDSATLQAATSRIEDAVWDLKR